MGEMRFRWWWVMVGVLVAMCCGCPPEPAPVVEASTPAAAADPSPVVEPAAEPAPPVTPDPATPPADAGPAGACPCEGRGYLIDPDRSGTNLRDAPGGAVVGQLPLQTDPAFEAGVYVTISASRDRWLQIDAVEDVPSGTHAGRWVYGKLIGTSTRNYAGQDITLRATPDAGAASAGVLVGEQQLPILGCCGHWVYVEGKGAGGAAAAGWLEPAMQCANAVTNCS